jgi:hypothetical protein
MDLLDFDQPSTTPTSTGGSLLDGSSGGMIQQQLPKTANLLDDLFGDSSTPSVPQSMFQPLGINTQQFGEMWMQIPI